MPFRFAPVGPIIIDRRFIFRSVFDIDNFDSLYKKVLVLNRCFLPVHITTVKRAVSLLFLEAAKGVDVQYQTYTWEQLMYGSFESLPEDCFLPLRTTSGYFPVPKVIVLNDYDQLPKRSVRFSRTHVFMRDQYTCQYCGDEFPKAKLNLDHVVPRSRGGKTTWDNLVTSCHDCNRKKANLTPQEASMPLRCRPRKPAGTFGLVNLRKIQESWTPFLLVDS